MRSPFTEMRFCGKKGRLGSTMTSCNPATGADRPGPKRLGVLPPPGKSSSCPAPVGTSRSKKYRVGNRVFQVPGQTARKSSRANRTSVRTVFRSMKTNKPTFEEGCCLWHRACLADRPTTNPCFFPAQGGAKPEVCRMPWAESP